MTFNEQSNGCRTAVESKSNRRDNQRISRAHPWFIRWHRRHRCHLSRCWRRCPSHRCPHLATRPVLPDGRSALPLSAAKQRRLPLTQLPTRSAPLPASSAALLAQTVTAEAACAAAATEHSAAAASTAPAAAAAARAVAPSLAVTAATVSAAAAAVVGLKAHSCMQK